MTRAFPVRLLAATALLLISSVPVSAAPERLELSRPDGSVLNWTLDLPDREGPVPLIVLAQGSGCASVEASAGISFARAAFADFAAVTVEKYGVAPGDTGVDCSAAYFAHHTNAQRVRDYLFVLSHLQGRPWWNRKFVLLGGSEGGDVAARMLEASHADAAILLSVGTGRWFREDLRDAMIADMKRSGLPDAQLPDVDAIFQHIRENPDSDEIFGGQTYRYWADTIDRRASDDLLRSSVPILLIHGTGDKSVPVLSARMTADRFHQAGKDNLTYWELVGHDHFMRDGSAVSRMQDVLMLARAWLDMRWKAQTD